MNYKTIGRIIAEFLAIEAVFMIPAAIICFADGDTNAGLSFIYTILLCSAAGGILWVLCRHGKRGFHAREGLVCIGIAWIVLSLFGCLPFVFSGSIPNYVDALFEIVSGFTTTGASILPEVESLPRGIVYWRSFSHWLGGMGVLVFLLAIIPKKDNSGVSMHLLRAESPGPNVGKLVPHLKDTALILYLIYILLTVLNIVFLIIGKMPLFDAVCTAFGTAGTGGFGIKNDSIESYSIFAQNVCTVFMFLFGVNFNCYFLLLIRQFKSVYKDEELRVYVGVAVSSVIMITINLLNSGIYKTFGETLRHTTFQVSSIMTTTGFATTNFDKWPTFSKSILLCLMIIGACAGSTGGGIKCGRILILFKVLRRNIRQVLHPNKVQVIRNNGVVLDEKVLETTKAYLCAYTFIVLISFVIIAVDGFSLTTNFSAVLACFNNIGPGMEVVGPKGNYSQFSDFSKLVLIVDMLAGRLEIYPIMVLFTKTTWKRN